MMFSPILVVGGVTLIAAITWRWVIYPVFLSPLAYIPAAHPSAHISSFWIEWQRFRGVEFDLVTTAFQTKGPYIRLGPNEVAVNDIEAVRDAWGVGTANFDKHSSYKFFGTHGATNTFTSLLSSEHRHRRHRVRIVYTRAFLLSSPNMRAILQNIVQNRVRPLIAKVAASESGACNVLPFSQAYVLDYVSAFVFGLPLSHQFLRDTAALQQWTDWYNASFPGGTAGFWRKEHPKVARFLSLIGIPVEPHDFAQARYEFEDWALRRVDAAQELLRQRDEGNVEFSPGELPTLFDAVRQGMADTQDQALDPMTCFVPSPAQRLELAAECLDHIASTSETFGTTFTYMLYELSRNPDIQTRLRLELQTIENNPFKDTSNNTNLPRSDQLQNLPFLEGVITESLRLRNTSPNLDPRVSPPNRTSRLGRIASIPPGTRVGACGWWLNRNSDVYPNPAEWTPQRWLSDKSIDVTVLNKWNFAFGSGSRNCIGQPIAMELMRMGLAAIYSSYKTSIHDETEYPGANQPMSAGCSEKLLIHFEPIDSLI